MKLTRELIEELRAARTGFGPAARRRKMALLERCAGLALADVRVLLDYHDILLFIIACPDDARIRARARTELERAAEAAEALAATARGEKALHGSGIAGSTVEPALTLDGTRWLAGAYPDDVEIAWEDESAGEALDEFLFACVERAEGDGLLSSRLSTREWMDLARGDGASSNLAWLIGRLDRLGCPPAALDRLFESLQLHVRWRLRRATASTTFLRFPEHRPCFHLRALKRSFSMTGLLRRPVPAVAPLPVREARRLIETARATLAVRQRETDPVTYANPREVTRVVLERGLDIVLFGMQPERRQPIESFFGYVAARNGVPIGYGGAWIFGRQAEIGVNVFDPFRGGESTYLFGQIMRTYRHHYGVERFFVPPFQIGADNAEGIRTGAFWFYYRLGFRPLLPELRELAAIEWERIAADRSYRTRPAVLRRFASDRIALDVPGARARSVVEPSLSELGLAVTGAIGERFAGDREAAARWARTSVARRLDLRRKTSGPEGQRRAFDQLSLLVALIEDLGEWSTPEKRALARLMHAKGGVRERDYALAVQRHDRLREALGRLLDRGAPRSDHNAPDRA